MNTEIITRTELLKELDGFKKEMLALLGKSAGFPVGNQVSKGVEKVEQPVNAASDRDARRQKIIMDEFIKKCTLYPSFGSNAYFEYKDTFWFYTSTGFDKKEEQERLAKLYEIPWQIINLSKVNTQHSAKPMTEFLKDHCCNSIIFSPGCYYKYFTYEHKTWFYPRARKFTTDEELNLELAQEKVSYNIMTSQFYTVVLDQNAIGHKST